jgi:hypothetical protein
MVTTDLPQLAVVSFRSRLDAKEWITCRVRYFPPGVFQFEKQQKYISFPTASQSLVGVSSFIDFCSVPESATIK